MDIDGFEGNFVPEFQGHHDHPGNPEENDIKSCNQHIGGMEGFQLVFPLASPG